MVSRLEEIVSSFNNVDISKSSDRKDLIKKIQSLLGSQDVCKKITENTNNKNGKNHLTWRFILKITIKIFNFDTSNVCDPRGPKVKMTKRKSFDSINLLKLVFKLSSQDKPTLNSSMLMRFIGDVLEKKVLLELCGNELLSTVFNHHFCHKEVWLSAGSHLVFDFLEQMLATYKHSLTSSQTSLDVIALSRYINMSVDNACAMLLLADAAFLRGFFETLQHSLNLRRQLQLIEFDLRTMNILMLAFMFDSCDVVCEVGEEVFKALLLLWSSQPSERIKLDMMNFFHLQMTLHNPHMSHGGESTIWRSHLKSLMRVLIEDVVNLTSKHKFLTGFNGNRELDFFGQFFNLFATIFVMLMGESLEGTSGDESVEPVFKKRKKQVLSFSWLRDQLEDSTSSQSALPWLCIMARVVNKKRRTMKEEEVLDLLEAVSVYIRQGGTAMNEALMVIGELIQCSMTHQLYNDVAILVEKKLTIQPDQQDSFNFLSLMIIYKPDLYKPSNEFISLFQSASLKHSLQPIMFLYHLCNSYKFLNEISFKSRSSLLQWLLPGFNYPDNDFEADSHKTTIASEHVILISHIITMLCTHPNSLSMFTPLLDNYNIEDYDDTHNNTFNNDVNNKESYGDDNNGNNNDDNNNNEKNSNMAVKHVVRLLEEQQNPMHENAKWLLCKKTCYFPIIHDEEEEEKEEDGYPDRILTDQNDSNKENEMTTGNIGFNDKMIVNDNGDGLRGDDGGDVVACVVSFLAHQLEALKGNKIEKTDVKGHMNVVWLCVHLMTHPLSQFTSLANHVYGTLSSLSECLEILLASSGAEDQAEVLATMCGCPPIFQRHRDASTALPSAVPVQFLSVIIDYVKKLISKPEESASTSSPTQFFGIEDNLNSTTFEMEEKPQLDLNESMFEPKLTACVGPRSGGEGGALTGLSSLRHLVAVDAVNFFMRNIELFRKHEKMLYEFVGYVISSEVPLSLRVAFIHSFSMSLRDQATNVPTAIISTIVSTFKLIVTEHHTDEKSIETVLTSLLHLSKHIFRCTMEALTSSQNTESQPIISTHQLLQQKPSQQPSLKDELFSCIAILFSFCDIYNTAIITLLSDVTLELIKEKVIPRDYLYDVSEGSQKSRTLLEVISPLFFRRHFVVRYQFCRLFASFLNSNREADNHMTTTTNKHAQFLFQHAYQLICDEKSDPSTICHLLLMVWRNSIHLRSLVIHAFIQSPSIHPSFPQEYIINSLQCLAETQDKNTIASFVGDYLGNITKTFLRNNTPIHHFPHHLLHYPSFHLFFRNESVHVIPVFFLGSKYLDQLINTIEEMNEEKEEYIKRYLLDVLVLIIPYYVLKKSPMICEDEVLGRNVKKAVFSYNYLINLYSLKNLSMLVEKNLSDVLYRVFRMYFDTSDYNGVYSSDPEINEANISPPTCIITFTKPIISSFLSYLVSSSKATNILQLLSMSRKDGLQTIIVRLTSDVIKVSSLSSKCHHMHALVCFVSCVKEYLSQDESLAFIIVHVSVFVANLFRSIFFKKKYTRQGGREKREVEHMVAVVCECYKELYSVGLTAQPMLTRKYSACVTSALWELSSLGNQEQVKALLEHIDCLNTIPDAEPSLENSLRSFYTNLHSNQTSFHCGFPPTKTLKNLSTFLNQHCFPENESRILAEVKLKILNLLLLFITTLHPSPFSFFKSSNICSTKHLFQLNIPATEQSSNHSSHLNHDHLLHHPLSHHPLPSLPNLSSFHQHTTLHNHMKQHQIEFLKDVVSCIGLLCCSVDDINCVSNAFDFCDNNKKKAKNEFNKDKNNNRKNNDDNDENKDDDEIVYQVVQKYLLQYLNSALPELVHTTCECLKQLLSDKTISLMISNKFNNNINNDNDKKSNNDDSHSFISSNDNNRENYKILFPFFLEKARHKTNKCQKSLKDVITDSNVWLKSEGSELVQRIVLSILNTEEFAESVFYSSILDVCRLKADICSFIFPSCIHQCLMNNISLSDEISTQLNIIIKHYNDDRAGFSRSSVVDILQTLEYLREKNKPHAKTPWDNHFWLNMDLLEVSKASIKAGLHHSALYFTEVLCLQDSCSEVVEDLWLEAYEVLGMIDCLQACSKRRLLDPFKKLKVLQAEGRWQESLTLCDLLGNKADIHKLTALQNLECNNLLQEYLHSRSNSGIEMTSSETEMRYKMASQLSTWNLPVSNNQAAGFHQLLYNCQCGIMRHQPSITHQSLQAIKGMVIRDLSMTRRGACSSSLLACVLNKCRILSCVEAVSLGNIASRWEVGGWDEEFLRHRISMAHICRGRREKERVLFKAAEAAREAGKLELAEGCLMRLKQSLRVVDSQSQSSIIQPNKNLHNKLKISNNNNSCDLFNMTNSFSGLLESSSNSDDDIFMEDDGGDVVGRAEWLLEEATLRWCKGDQHEALHLVKTLVAQEPPSLLLVRALVKMGDWLVDSQSESPSFIIESCYEKALNTLKTLRPPTRGGGCPPLPGQECLIALEAHRSLASYTDTQYNLKTQYMQSSVFEDRMKLMKESGEEVEKMKKMKQAKGQYFTTIHKQLQIDKAELSKVQQDAQSFLITAVLNYLKCLRLTSDDTCCTYKLISLWFDNCNVAQVNDLIKEHLDSLPSHTFVNLMYQVAARMSLDDDMLQRNIRKLVGRCTKDHPHHVLPIIFSLSNAKRQQNKSQDADDDGRIKAAKRLVEELQEDGKMGGLVRAMQWLNLAYIDLSFLDASAHRNDTKPVKLPSSCALNNINKHPNAHLIAMPTLQLPVSPKADYSNVTYITSINATFSLAGGLNLPKIITCLCSDGVVRKQLVKGKDDLRQDAVMQQVFSCVNECLRGDKDAQKRGLCVRTYKVVPLSQQSGVLEWCNETQSLGDYLCHPDYGAHLRYRPKDLKPLDARRAMNKAHSDGGEKVKLATYKKICASFQPVLRHFFFENFTSASTWVQRRLAYTASVSTNSIVGYILGLGDRHIQNILIDKNTAELIHIDFGVAFEQGWNLPTPETVPFRLTRDLTDAMGVLGVEGPFGRYCEKTLVALKAWKEILMTILQVMLHDPMYHWSINKSLTRPSCNNNLTCAQLQDKYGASRQGGNKVAERVLRRVRDKLQGFECGVQLSVEGHVSHLIQVATDPNNLSRLFPGWQAYV